MAIDALAIPGDIAWQRLGFMSAMIERGFADERPSTCPPRLPCRGSLMSCVARGTLIADSIRS
jgi:hypothetical protein